MLFTDSVITISQQSTSLHTLNAKKSSTLRQDTRNESVWYFSGILLFLFFSQPMEHLLKYSGWPVWLECFHDADGNGSHEEDTRKGQNSLGLKYMCFRIDKKMVLLIDELLLSTTCQQPKTTGPETWWLYCIHELKNYILQLVLHRHLY